MFEVIILSVLQGVAEFLPISSSGHLVLGRSLLGLGEVGLRLDVFLHVGTLVAVFAFYRATVARLAKGLFAQEAAARTEAWSYAAKIVLSAVPAGLVGVLFKDQVEGAFAAPRMVGFALLFTGAVLTATRFLPKGGKDVSFGRALAMGVAQAVAILPGVSRSGMTLAAARAAKVDAEKSAEFSFLMSAPPIAGAALLEVARALGASGDAAAAATAEVSWGLCAAGAVLAAVVGYFSLKLLVSSLKSRWFWLFGPYCFLAGALALAFCG
jgi:undecaprenyl-diphosphatase